MKIITRACEEYLESIANAEDDDTIARLVDESCGYVRGVYDCGKMAYKKKGEWSIRFEQAGEDRSRELEDGE